MMVMATRQQAAGSQNSGGNKQAKSGKLAIVLIRGLLGVRSPIKRTLFQLRLTRRNHCVLVDDTPAFRGMAVKVKDYTTWGEVSDAFVAELVKVRGEEFQKNTMDRKKLYSYKSMNVAGKLYKPYLRLNPPRKGFERKGVKIAYAAGGALGYRGAEMEELLRRMM